MAQLKTGSTVNGIAIVVTNDSRLSDARTPLEHTQAASTITDFDTEVSNNEDVAANTAARHSHTNKTILDNTTASFTTADENKLDGIEEGATNYSHPATHPASIITQDSNNRFMTDAEKEQLNGILGISSVKALYPWKKGDMVFVTEEEPLYQGTVTVAGGAAPTDYARGFVFSPDGSIMVMLCSNTAKAFIYDMVDSIPVYRAELYSDAGTTSWSNLRSAAFSPDGTLLIVTSNSADRRAVYYTVVDKVITYGGLIYADAGNTAFDGSVTTVAFHPSGSHFYLGGVFTGRCKVYAVSGTTFSYVGDVYMDAGTTLFDNTVLSVSINNAGTLMAIGGGFTGYLRVYALTNGIPSFLSVVGSFTDWVNICSFSPDGSSLVVTGDNAPFAELYSIEGQTLSLKQKLYGDQERHYELGNYAVPAAFSPDGTYLAIGGWFKPYGKIYKKETTGYYNFLCNIYKTAMQQTLDNEVYSLVFTPDGKDLYVGGWFDGYAKYYRFMDERLGRPLLSLNYSYHSVGRALEDAVLGQQAEIAEISPVISWALQAQGAKFFNGTGTFSAGSAEQYWNNAFITADTLVTVSPTSSKKGVWSVTSYNGSFIITSDEIEPVAVTFDWGAVK